MEAPQPPYRGGTSYTLGVVAHVSSTNCCIRVLYELLKGLSHMRLKSHVWFLGEPKSVMALAYPTTPLYTIRFAEPARSECEISAIAR